MQKIYLAISDKTYETKEQVRELFNDVYQGATQEWLDTKEAVHTVAQNENDFILIVDNFFFSEIEQIPKRKDTTYYIHPSLDNKIDGHDRITIFPSLSALRIHLFTRKLQNKSIKQKKNKKQADKDEAASQKGNKEKLKTTHSNKLDTAETEESETAVYLKEDKDDDQAEQSNMSNKTETEVTLDTKKSEQEEIQFKMKQLGVAGRREYRYARNKTIGVWSPVSQNGVTTLIMNLAIYLGLNHKQTAVIESLKQHQEIHTILNRIHNVPEDWSSYISMILNKDISPKRVGWNYRGVNWYPLATHDIEKINQAKLNKEMTYLLTQQPIQEIKVHDFVFVDLPAGEMNEYTLSTLEQLDELWIVSNGNYPRILAWKEYIDTVIKPYQIDLSLIIIKKGNKVREKKIAEDLSIPLLTCLPNLSEEIDNNYYQKKALIEYKNIKIKLEESFQDILKHISTKEIKYSFYQSLLIKMKDFLRTRT